MEFACESIALIHPILDGELLMGDQVTVASHGIAFRWEVCTCKYWVVRSKHLNPSY
jgi:hypothetical protein